MRGRGACMAGGVYGRVGACVAGGRHRRGACMVGGMHERGHAWWGGHVWQGGMHGQGVCMAGVYIVGGVGVLGVCGGHAWPWGAWPGGMCGRGRVSVEGVCMAGGVSGIGACVTGETATAAGWYASYWNAFLFCRKLQENETIWTLRGIRVPGTPLDPPMLDVVGPVPWGLPVTCD